VLAAKDIDLPEIINLAVEYHCYTAVVYNPLASYALLPVIIHIERTFNMNLGI
jgi:hypothetical protein